MKLVGGGKKQRRLARTPALDAHEAASVQGFRVVCVQVKRNTKTFVCASQIAAPQFRQSQLEPAFRGVTAAQGVGGEFRFRVGGFSLLQPEHAEVVMSLRQ